jgi:hypothetical protein
MERFRSLTALTVGFLAALAALGGLALASGGVSAAKKKGDAKADTKLFTQLLTKAAPTLAVGHAGTADTATNASAANTLGGRGANGLGRVAFARSTNSALLGDGNSHDVLSVTINAPTSGYLMTKAGSDVFNSTGSGAYRSAICWIDVDGTTDSATNRQNALNPNVTDSSAHTLGANTEENCVTNGTEQVTAGAHTVRFRANPDAGMLFDEATLSVVFVPFDGSGNSP